MLILRVSLATTIAMIAGVIRFTEKLEIFVKIDLFTNHRQVEARISHDTRRRDTGSSGDFL